MSKKYYTDKEAKRVVIKHCEQKGYTFVEFCDKDGNPSNYYGKYTYLHLKCNKCGYEWKSVTYQNFTTLNRGCPQCSNHVILTSDMAIQKIHDKCKDSKYVFLHFCDKEENICEWHGNTTLLLIQCNECHNLWKVSYSNFITLNRTCPYCKKTARHSNKQAFNIITKKALMLNYVFYGFCDKKGNICEYLTNSTTYLHLKCNKCGYEWKSTSFSNFIAKEHPSCPYCVNNVKHTTNEAYQIVVEHCKKKEYTFLGFCDKKGNDCEYLTNSTTYLHLKCNKCGYEWKSTSFSNFISRNKGCPQCNLSKLEEEIKLFLQENNIVFEEQKRFDWLGQQSLDFYLPKYSIAIECQGIQHFKPIDFFGGIDGLKKQKERDTIKQNLCVKNNIKVLYYSNLNINYPYKVIQDKEYLIHTLMSE